MCWPQILALSELPLTFLVIQTHGLVNQGSRMAAQLYFPRQKLTGFFFIILLQSEGVAVSYLLKLKKQELCWPNHSTGLTCMPETSVSKSALRPSAVPIPPILGLLGFFHVSFLSYVTSLGLKLLPPNINSCAVCGLLWEDVLVLWTAEVHGHYSGTFLSWGGHSTVLQPPPQGWWCFTAGVLV